MNYSTFFYLYIKILIHFNVFCPSMTVIPAQLLPGCNQGCLVLGLTGHIKSIDYIIPIGKRDDRPAVGL